MIETRKLRLKWNGKLIYMVMGFLDDSAIKNPPANAGDARESVSIPGSGRSGGEGMATHSNIHAWKIPWTKEPGRLQSMGLQSQTQLSDFTFTFLVE